VENRRDLELLVQKYINNNCSKEELYRLLDMITQPENMDVLDKILDTTWETENNQTYPVDIDENAEALLQKFKNRPRHPSSKTNPTIKPKPYLFFLKIAAAILFLISMVWVIRNLSVEKPERKIALVSTARPVAIERTAQQGERLNVKLSDGSQVILKAGSKLTAPDKFEGKLRKISLNGEAFFKVTPDKTKPFIVSTDKFTVKVLGTSFNIHSYLHKDLASVTVETGKVEVCIENTNGHFILLPGDQIELNKTTGKSILKKHIDTKQYISWIDKELNFERTPLPEVVKKIETCYGVTINLQFPQAEETVITGQYKNDSLAGILRLLTFTTGTTYSIKGTEVVIEKNK
jgi:transmembrane sensor